MIRRLVTLGALVVALTAAGLAQSGTGESWPTYHGDYSGRHYSPLKQITVANVKNLSLAWVFRTTAPRQAGRPPAPAPAIKAIPLMVDGVLYVSTPNQVFAVDARTGEQIWQYVWPATTPLAIAASGCSATGCTWPRPTTASSRSTRPPAGSAGTRRWWRRRRSTSVTSAPVVIRNHVIVGIGGDGGGSQSFLESLDPETGASQWKWLTTPGKGEPGIETWPNAEVAARSAGAPWLPPTYDPDPEPDLRHDRAADAHLQRQGPRG